MHGSDATDLDWRAIDHDVRDLVRAALMQPHDAAESWARWIARHDVDTLPDGAFAVLPAVSANLPDDVLGGEAARLRGIRRRTWSEVQLALPVVDEVVDALTQAGAEVMLVGALAQLAADRPSGSVPLSLIELAIRPAAFDDSVRTLVTSGWAPDPGPAWSHVRRFERDGSRMWLHRWQLFPVWSRQPDDDSWARSEPLSWRGREVCRRSSADEFVALSVPQRAPTVVARRLLDAVAVLRSGAESDAELWDTLRSAVPTDVRSIVADALDVCRREFGVPVPHDLIDELVSTSTPRRERSGERGRFDRYRAISLALGDRPSTIAYMADRWSTVRRIGVRRAVERRVRSRSRPRTA